MVGFHERRRRSPRALRRPISEAGRQFGFEEFRRDFEDQGRWIATEYYSGKSFPSKLVEGAKAAFNRSGCFTSVVGISEGLTWIHVASMSHGTAEG